MHSGQLTENSSFCKASFRNKYGSPRDQGRKDLLGALDLDLGTRAVLGEVLSGAPLWATLGLLPSSGPPPGGWQLSPLLFVSESVRVRN